MCGRKLGPRGYRALRFHDSHAYVQAYVPLASSGVAFTRNQYKVAMAPFPIPERVTSGRNKWATITVSIVSECQVDRRVGAAPGVEPVVDPSGRGVLPLRFGRQSPAVPGA